MRRRSLLALLSAPLALWAPSGRADTLQGPERRVLLDAARGPAEAALRQPLRFFVTALNREGVWAFLLATMQRPDGGRPRRAMRDDLTSDSYVALLRREGSGWRIVDFAVGPTDVAWQGWDRQHGAPASVFVIPEGR
ncbi:hypothetical protein Q8W71_30365 [Methylobacterium sp. NEAU 140]|uniref:hypothetical protein n=1 Tax=Methylobacterium sp. NEAU 140 TaxID=3064945 RepID=UPI002735B6E7|nr:hypothetical protein [Methylobacterium sp. NEAU 140]MDP4026899.1 hypothetical protein [Methylobacterium sp. NEAU 140]